jgi:hypothetical protein
MNGNPSPEGNLLSSCPMYNSWNVLSVRAIIYFCDFSDINECMDDSDNCHDDATCQNIPGSFSCTCNPGYTGSGTDCTGLFTLQCYTFTPQFLVSENEIYRLYKKRHATYIFCKRINSKPLHGKIPECSTLALSSLSSYSCLARIWFFIFPNL